MCIYIYPPTSCITVKGHNCRICFVNDNDIAIKLFIDDPPC